MRTGSHARSRSAEPFRRVPARLKSACSDTPIPTAIRGFEFRDEFTGPKILEDWHLYTEVHRKQKTNVFRGSSYATAVSEVCTVVAARNRGGREKLIASLIRSA